jgi:hypothetical protein
MYYTGCYLGCGLYSDGEAFEKETVFFSRPEIEKLNRDGRMLGVHVAL